MTGVACGKGKEGFGHRDTEAQRKKKAEIRRQKEPYKHLLRAAQQGAQNRSMFQDGQRVRVNLAGMKIGRAHV